MYLYVCVSLSLYVYIIIVYLAFWSHREYQTYSNINMQHTNVIGNRHIEGESQVK